MKSTLSLVFLGLFVMGCNTTNSFMRLTPDYSDLPAAELRTLADEVEVLVSGEDGDRLLATSTAIVVDTPAMKQAIRTRAIRHPLISELLDTGFAEELGNGLIEIKRSRAYKAATTTRQRDREALLVMSENENRWALYEGLVKANGWRPNSLSAIQETFFKARVPLLKAGQLHAPVE